MGLTGGIAGGKSTISDFFRLKGAFIIDHDLITREVQEPDGAAWQGIVDHFGETILNPDRSVNREALGKIVFSDPMELRKLNEIVHPAVYAQWKSDIARIEAQKEDAVIISDIPLLIEVGWTADVDLLIVVFIPPEEQIRRLMNRNGLSFEDAHKRLASQMQIAEKLKYADFVIDNSGTIEETRKKVDAVWEELIEREQKKRRQR